MRNYAQSRQGATSRPQGAQSRPLSRQESFGICFGGEGGWDDEKVLDRYELLYEAGLFREAETDGREAARQWQNLPYFGASMQFDHRRILATAMSRLRAKIKYRPVIFELMPDSFTLFELQRTVEAILGSHLHKQISAAWSLVGARRTTAMCALLQAAARKSLRFRREVILERPAAGVRVKGGRG